VKLLQNCKKIKTTFLIIKRKKIFLSQYRQKCPVDVYVFMGCLKSDFRTQPNRRLYMRTFVQIFGVRQHTILILGTTLELLRDNIKHN
jgi:hypothetical protein